MSNLKLLAELFAGPYVSEIYEREGWLVTMYEVHIRGEGCLPLYRIRWGLREVLDSLAATEERLLKTNPQHPGPRGDYEKACGEHFVELCRETAKLATHLARGGSPESFPGYRLAPDKNHHVYFKGRDPEQDLGPEVSR